MLICPQCQADNSDNNKFCESCGASLTNRNCFSCGQVMAYEMENCPQCGAFNAVVWTAIVAHGLGEEISYGEYLDGEQRYRIIPSEEDLTPIVLKEQGLQIHKLLVVDTNPLRVTNLYQLFVQVEDDPEAAANLIPEMASPYIELESFNPTIPHIHDTWQEGSKEFVLIEPRQQWSLLEEIWSSESLPNGQILFWLDEMSKIWQQLSSLGYCRTLTLEENLILDEDEVLCVERLYMDLSAADQDIKGLAKVWERLFAKSGRTQYGPIIEMLSEIKDGTLTTIEQVRSKIDAIVQEADGPPEEQLNDFDDDEGEMPKPFDFAADEDKMFFSSDGDDAPTIVLPMQLLSLTHAGYTDIGTQRDHNEDYFTISTQINTRENALGRNIEAKGLYLVCDGMGGHSAGEIASAMAAEKIHRYFDEHWQGKELPSQEMIQQAIFAANEAIYNTNVDNSRTGSGRMGTTLVMLLIRDNKVALAHVGDSRIYRVTKKWGIEQLTVDHEVGQREIKRGVSPDVAYARPDAYQLTQALGPRDNEFIEPTIDFLELNEDTLFVICSDGLSDNDLLEKHWEEYLSPLISSRSNLDQGLIKLVDFANEFNGHDNITAIAIRVKVRPNMDQAPLF
ncbi:MAG: serine/threonine phosphatase [Synechococcaceae cyanobacterium RL_1_2]|nr:serine/threonine phosphatase [Synechococcaceae cyanobacterium RL_1_2]